MRKWLFLIFTAVLLISIAFLWKQPEKQSVNTNIKSFEDCATAGYPIMESYPRQCRTVDGRQFTEIVTE